MQVPNAKDWLDPEDFTEDCEYYDICTGAAYYGHDGIRQLQAEMQDSMGAKTDSRTIKTVDNDQFTISWFEWYGELLGDMGGIKSKGKPFKVQGLTLIIKAENGKIAKQVDMWNLYGQLAQFGAVPPFGEHAKSAAPSA